MAQFGLLSAVKASANWHSLSVDLRGYLIPLQVRHDAHIVRNMNSRDVIATLEAAGWQLKRVTGSHHHFMHPEHPGIATVPHPKKDLPIGTVRSIEKQTGLKLR